MRAREIAGLIRGHAASIWRTTGEPTALRQAVRSAALFLLWYENQFQKVSFSQKFLYRLFYILDSKLIEDISIVLVVVVVKTIEVV